MTCPTCNGTGGIPLPGGTATCPACGGTGIDVTVDERVPLHPEPPRPVAIGRPTRYNT